MSKKPLGVAEFWSEDCAGGGMQHCPRCRAPLFQYAEFCLRCGSSLAYLYDDGYVESLTVQEVVGDLTGHIKQVIRSDVILGVTIEREAQGSPPAARPDSRTDLPSPPRWATYLLHLVLPHKERRALVGDLCEEYGDIQTSCGTPAAVFWICWQALRSSIRLAVVAWIARQLGRFLP
jgi:hypothetical protein